MLANSRKAPLCRVEGADRPAQPVSQSSCAGVGDRDAVAHICYDCAMCLCVDDKLIKMPRYALANQMFLGREHPLLQDSTPGLRLLLGFGRPCFRKLLLGKGRGEDRESGTTGNHILVSQGAPMAAKYFHQRRANSRRHLLQSLGKTRTGMFHAGPCHTMPSSDGALPDRSESTNAGQSQIFRTSWRNVLSAHLYWPSPCLTGPTPHLELSSPHACQPSLPLQWPGLLSIC